MMPFTVRPPEMRCWLFEGGLRFGRGPLEGARRAVVELGGGARVGFAGGGIRLAEGFGGGGIIEADGAGVVDPFSLVVFGPGLS
jgi:hypothetical protein